MQPQSTEPQYRVTFNHTGVEPLTVPADATIDELTALVRRAFLAAELVDVDDNLSVVIDGDDDAKMVTAGEVDLFADGIKVEHGFITRIEPPTDPRRAIYEIVTTAIAKGLPLSQGTNIPGHYSLATILLPRNDKAGVDAWSSYLNLPAPVLDSEPLDTGATPYSVTMADFPAVPDWHITVQCFCTEDGAL